MVKEPLIYVFQVAQGSVAMKFSQNGLLFVWEDKKNLVSVSWGNYYVPTSPERNQVIFTEVM